MRLHNPPMPPYGRSLLRLSPPRPLPLLLWLVIQTLTLLAAAARLPLTPHYPAAAERLAPEEMLYVQLAASALLFPLILPDAAT